MKNTEWFKFLSDDEQERFMVNLRINYYFDLDSECFKDFISSAFTWDYSSEGHEYWSDIAHDNRRIKNYLPIKNVLKHNFV